ncbi:MAG: DUF4198 domain-containing protein [Pseudomonadota bacterium]
MHLKVRPILSYTALGLVIPLLASPANGHELWIDPTRFTLPSDNKVSAELRVGENYSGGSSPFLPSRTERLEFYVGKTGIPITGRAGDRPAINFDPEAEGLVIIAYESDVSTVRYRDFEKFKAFVDHKRFAGALDNHRARGLSTDDFVETYSRHAKSLIAVGAGAGSDVEVGMVTEMIALDSPYKGGISDGIRVQVNYLGEPRIGVQVEIYARPSGEGNTSENVSVETVQTDNQGVAVIPVEPGMDYMLDAVVLREPPAERAAIRDAVWDSLWANLTFSVPARP